MNPYWWTNLKGRVWAWHHNLATRVGGAIVRLFALQPRCACGWRLAQRSDGTWLCGHCLNVAFPEGDVLRGRRKPTNWPCDCYFCEGVVRERRDKLRKSEGS